MKLVKLFVLAALALTAAQGSRAAIGPSCAFFCAQVRCVPEDVCGSFVNSSGQTVCGCHSRD